MFMYERNGAICVTFKSNAPVDAPDYVIVVDEKTQSVIVNGKSFSEPVTEEAPVAATKKAKKAVEPLVEEVTEPAETSVETVAE